MNHVVSIIAITSILDDAIIVVITVDTIVIDTIAVIVVIVVRLCEAEETLTWIVIFW